MPFGSTGTKLRSFWVPQFVWTNLRQICNDYGYLLSLNSWFRALRWYQDFPPNTLEERGDSKQWKPLYYPHPWYYIFWGSLIFWGKFILWGYLHFQDNLILWGSLIWFHPQFAQHLFSWFLKFGQMVLQACLQLQVLISTGSKPSWIWFGFQFSLV